MGKTIYRMKNMFKSPQEREIEARMEFNKNKRAFNKYYQDLDVSIRNFSKMARDAELSGNHLNALSCAKFVAKLQKTQVRVQGLLQRFEMMYSMQRLAGVMTNFMKACTDMGFSMNTNIDLKSMWKNTAAMDEAIGKLDAMTEQMDMVFDTIDQGMSSGGETMLSQDEQDEEAKALLDNIMGRHNDLSHPQAEPAAASVELSKAPAVPQQAAPADDTDEKLEKMIQDLRND